MSSLLLLLAVAGSTSAAVVPDRWLHQATSEGVVYAEVCQVVRPADLTRLEHAWINCGGLATAGRIDLSLTVRDGATFTLLGAWGGWIDAEFASRWFGFGAEDVDIVAGPDDPILIGLAIDGLDAWDGTVGPRLDLHAVEPAYYLADGQWHEAVPGVGLSVGWIGDEVEASEATIPEPWAVVALIVLAVASRV